MISCPRCFIDLFQHVQTHADRRIDLRRLIHVMINLWMYILKKYHIPASSWCTETWICMLWRHVRPARLKAPFSSRHVSNLFLPKIPWNWKASHPTILQCSKHLRTSQAFPSHSAVLQPIDWNRENSSALASSMTSVTLIPRSIKSLFHPVNLHCTYLRTLVADGGSFSAISNTVGSCKNASQAESSALKPSGFAAGPRKSDWKVMEFSVSTDTKEISVQALIQA